MTTEETKEIIEAHQLRYMLKDRPNKKGDGTTYKYIVAGKYDPAIKRSRSYGIGSIERVEAMSPQELVALIQEKFGDLVKQL